MNGYFIKNIGQNRGKPRIWLERLEVASANLAPGDRYDVHINGGRVMLKANPDGSRVVSKKVDRAGRENPVIDINSEELLALFDGMSSVRLVQRDGEIHLLPLATEIKKKERLDRLKRKVIHGEPLTVGSLSHGAGLMSAAIHEGLEAGGLKTRLAVANEIRPELLIHAADANPIWNKQTLALGAPMQELAFDEAAMRHLPRVEVMEAGLPCSGASKSGRAKRGTAMPEEHPEVGHLVVAALVILSKTNPAAIVFENVIPYSNSASAAILRNQLRDMGYQTHETVLRGEEFNALEHRDRWCMVAVTEGMHFSWDMLVKPEKADMALSDVLDDISSDDPMWSEMKGLKDKQERDIAAGKGFLMQVFKGDDTKIATITKGYAKVRSTDPKIAHPTDPNLLRQLTPSEHAKVKQHPPQLIENLCATIAHEVLGQAVLRQPFVAAGKALAETINQFAKDQPISAVQLIQAFTDEMASTISESVTEIRRPLPKVVYEGPVTINDAGMVIQDIGNGVGILHMSSAVEGSALEKIRLGEELRVRYPSTKSVPEVERLSTQAPAVTPELQTAIAQHQLNLLDSDLPATPKRSFPRLG